MPREAKKKRNNKKKQCFIGLMARNILIRCARVALLHSSSGLPDIGSSGVARILVWGGQCIHCFI